MTTINSAQSALRDLIGLIPLKLREQAHDDITTIEQLISDYERLSAEGKHREAGEKLDQLKQVLAELKR